MTTRARVLVADPAWKFDDKLPGDARGADKHYRTLEPWEICRFPLPPMEDDSMLVLWRVSSLVEEAYDVVRAWGFKPKTELVWRKLTKEGKAHIGMGHYLRGAHETAIIATRGRVNTKIVDKAIRTIFEAPVGEHSAKPDAFYDLIERLLPGPYVELFARRERPGWTCFGDELSNVAPTNGGTFVVDFTKAEEERLAKRATSASSPAQLTEAPTTDEVTPTAEKVFVEPEAAASSATGVAEAAAAPTTAVKRVSNGSVQTGGAMGWDAAKGMVARANERGELEAPKDVPPTKASSTDAAADSADSDATGKRGRKRANFEPLTTLCSELEALGQKVSLITVAGWTPKERKAAEVWVDACHELTDGIQPMIPPHVVVGVRALADMKVPGQTVETPDTTARDAWRLVEGLRQGIVTEIEARGRYAVSILTIKAPVGWFRETDAKRPADYAPPAPPADEDGEDLARLQRELGSRGIRNEEQLELLRMAVDMKLLTKNEAASDEGWAKLTRVAPDGWFRAKLAGKTSGGWRAAAEAVAKLEELSS